MIQQSTFAFLSDLQEHNNREWFEQNKKRYEAAKRDVTGFVNELIAGMISFDGSLAGLEAKDTMFRIFRDVRFSHDKSPYKNNMGAWMARGGRKSVFAGYYLHIQPGDKSFLAGGSYMPEPLLLNSIREAVDQDAEEFLGIVENVEFMELFGRLEGDKLKSAPKGFSKDNPMIEYLKHKSFVVSRPLTDQEVLNRDFLDQAIATYSQMVDLNRFLNMAIAHVAVE